MDITVEDLPQNEQQNSPVTSPVSGPVEHLSIARHFNIDYPTNEEKGKLLEIWQHGKSLSETGDTQDVIWQIIHLQRTLGAPRLGEAPLDKIYRWAKLKRQQSHIEQELQHV